MWKSKFLSAFWRYIFHIIHMLNLRLHCKLSTRPKVTTVQRVWHEWVWELTDYYWLRVLSLTELCDMVWASCNELLSCWVMISAALSSQQTHVQSQVSRLNIRVCVCVCVCVRACVTCAIRGALYKGWQHFDSSRVLSALWKAILDLCPHSLLYLERLRIS